MRADQQEQFKNVANQLVGQVKDSIQSLNQNQLQRKATVDSQQTQMSALIEQTKKLVSQCGDSSRDLGNQQTVPSQQFAQMKQWKSDAEQEIFAGITCRKDLANHANAKTSGKPINQRGVARHEGPESKSRPNSFCEW